MPEPDSTQPEPPQSEAGQPAAPGRVRRPGARPLALVVLALLAAAAALGGSSLLTWTAYLQDRPGGGSTLVRHTGAEVSPALVPLALVCLAAIAAVVALGGWPRRVLGVLLVLAGLGAAWIGGFAGQGGGPGTQLLSTQQYQEQLHQASLTGALGRALAVLAGVLVIGAGVLLVLRARLLPRLGSSYQTPGAARAANKASADPDRELWNALSEGHDPTVGER